MDEDDLVEAFEAQRPRLLSVAARILGGSADAEDVVQCAWLKAERARRDRPDLEVDGLPGWLTVIVGRTALDLLRVRGRRGETTLDVARAEGAREEVDGNAADESVLMADEVGRALSLVVDRLGPAERVAFVLHDLFGVPFDDIGTVLGRSAAAAKQLASRARRKVGPDPATPPVPTRQLDVVRSFLAASRDGDLVTLLRVLAPDVVRTVDPLLVPPGTPLEVRGAAEVAEETRVFAELARSAVVMLLDGRPMVVMAPGGQVPAILRPQLDGQDRISAFRIDPASSGDRLRLVG